MSLVNLRAAGYALSLAPALGGSISRFTWLHPGGQNINLLRPMAAEATSSEAAGCFPLFPFSNRVRHGLFTFDGREIYLPRNTGGPHVEHGHGWQRAWTVTAQNEKTVTLSFTHDPAMDGGWPFPYRAEQQFALDESGLSVTLRAQNTGERPMPLGFGLHPYFPRSPRCRLRAHVSGFWEADAEVMPTRHVPVPEALDLDRGLALHDIIIDNVFTGFAGEAVIDWPESATSLTLTAGPELQQLVLYVPDAATQELERTQGIPPYFCAEPVSNITDAFNLAGKVETGLIVLAPNAAAVTSVHFAAGVLTSG
jgi:aldose 1-epimerase